MQGRTANWLEDCAEHELRDLEASLGNWESWLATAAALYLCYVPVILALEVLTRLMGWAETWEVVVCTALATACVPAYLKSRDSKRRRELARALRSELRRREMRAANSRSAVR
jgi:hypothetical protein